MAQATLYIFTISHYCEKARWALEYLGFDVDIQTLAPGTHVKVAQELGLKRSSVPILKTSNAIVQGSDEIIDWAEEYNTSEKNLETPELVKPIFMHNLSAWEQVKLTIKWPVIRKLMTKRMDLGHDQGNESLDVVRQEMDWLESQISDKASYLVGDNFSRADIAAASLLAPLVAPPEYGCSVLMRHPPRINQARSTMMNSPLYQWVEEKYRNHRL